MKRIAIFLALGYLSTSAHAGMGGPISYGPRSDSSIKTVIASTGPWQKSGSGSGTVVFLSTATDMLGVGTSTPAAKVHISGGLIVESTASIVGTLDAGHFTSSGTLTVEGQTVLGTLPTVSTVATTGIITAPSIRVQGAEASGGVLEIFADEGDDSNDQWTISASQANQNLNFSNAATAGSQLSITSAGQIEMGSALKSTVTAGGLVETPGLCVGPGCTAASGEFSVGGSTLVVTSGNVGIGTSVPASTAALTVNGNILAEGSGSFDSLHSSGAVRVAGQSVFGTLPTVSTVATTGIITAPSIRVQGAEASGGVLEIFADEGDDSNDQWTISASQASQNLNFSNAATAGTEFSITSAGQVEMGATGKSTATAAGLFETGGLCVGVGCTAASGALEVGASLFDVDSASASFNVPVRFQLKTVAELEAITPLFGDQYGCLDCANDVRVVFGTTTISGFDSSGVGGTAWH